MKSQNTNQNIFIALLLLLFCVAESKAQYFSSDYFSPVKISNQPRTDNTYLYASYGLFTSINTKESGITQPFGKNFAFAWYKNKTKSTKKGMELAFNYSSQEKGLVSSELDNKSGILGRRDYGLRFGAVTDFATFNFSGNRSIIDKQYKLWGVGYEMQFGGHPILTQNKHKWPISFSVGSNIMFQNQPNFIDDTEWADFKERGEIDVAEFELYVKLSLEHFTYKKQVGWYFRFDIQPGMKSTNILTEDLYNNLTSYSDVELVNLMGDLGGLYIRFGLSTGIMF